MALSLGLSLVASLACLLGARGPWRSRLHHLVPVPLMALGMGHLGSPGGLLTAAVAAGGLWVLGTLLARRARALRPDLWADAVDAFAMAGALLVSTLAGAAPGAAAGGLGRAVSVATATAGQGHGHGNGHAAVAMTGGGPVWPVVTAVVLVTAVMTSRVAARRGGRRRADVSSTVPALLMSASLVVMLAG